jgi:acetyl esterase/lipase
VATRAGAVVVGVDYRLAVSDVTYPVPHDDVVAAVRWVGESASALAIDPARISVGGASAGANLAAGATLRIRDEDGWLPAQLDSPTPSPIQSSLPPRRAWRPRWPSCRGCCDFCPVT